jgi:hypothetical protein
MSNLAAWNTPPAWATLINGSDLASLANGSTVLSSVTDIDNTTNLDFYLNISVRMTVASATPPAGASFGLYVVPLLDDGTTYGDGSMTSGSTITRAPPFPPAGTIYLESAVATTLLAGAILGIPIYPIKFRSALYNGSGAGLSGTAGNCIVKYFTNKINLNA